MNQESEATTAEQADKQPVVIASVQELHDARSKLIGLNYQIGQANTKRDKAVARAKDRFDLIKNKADQAAKVVTDPLEEEKAELLGAITKYLVSHERSWLKRFGKTHQDLLGIIKWRTPGVAVEMPKDAGPVVEFLLDYHGGKRFLDVQYTVNKKALTKASPKLRRELARLGVYIGRYRWLYLQPTGDDKQTLLAKWRFPRRRRK